MSLRSLKRAGVEVHGNAYIEKGAVVERGAKIYAPCYISSDCHICSGASVMPYSCLSDTYVGADTLIQSSILVGAHIGRGTTVGPYSYIRGGTVIGDGCRIGAFTEVKNCCIGDGTKMAHLAYAGDAQIGKNVNIGCGVVFANYNGKEKHASVVGDGCFIGCNCNIVAPVTVGKGSYIAAGTTLTQDLKDGDFCIGRSREKVKAHGAFGRYNGG